MFKPRQATASVNAPNPPSIEWVRQRAKHRLLGVSVLVLAGVLLFPMLFDTQPRPIPVDIPIEIPSRQSVKPLVVETPVAVAPSASQASPAAPAGRSTPAETIVASGGASAAPDDEEVVISGSPSAVKPRGLASAGHAPAPAATVVAPPPEAPRVTVAPSKPVEAPKPAKPAEAAKSPPAPPKATPASVPAAPSDAARAQALLDGKAPTPAVSAPPTANGGERFIVQVGAFAEAARAQQVRNQLERAGLKTYTHVAETAEGKRIRVRLGPFASRAEADKAAARAKAAGVPAAILTL